MNFVRYGLSKARKEGLARTLLAALDLVSQKMGSAWHNRGYFINPYAKKNSTLPPRNAAKICRDLTLAGVTVIPLTIDVADFQRWLALAQFPADYVELCEDSYPHRYPYLFIEKALEHFVSALLLEINEGDTLIDVGAAESPWYETAERLYGCVGYALDR